MTFSPSEVFDPLTIDLEAALARALERHFHGADGDTPANLADSIRYSLLAPGKRIRPRLSLACAAMLGLPLEAALPPALALEMIHCFTLIHDDLPCMDDDDFRRGKPSNHKVYGEAIALLAGDALMALSTDTYLDCAAVDPTSVIRGLKRLNWAMGPRGVMGGQAREPLLGEASTLSDLRLMHAGKTGALFSAAILMPMELSGISEASREGQALSVFAAELGVAFQVADDLEDGETEATTPTSILYYLPKAEARDRTIRALQAAMDSLESIWGDRARSLNRIAGEVIRSLQSH